MKNIITFLFASVGIIPIAIPATADRDASFDPGPEKNLERPDDYAAALSKQTKFVLHCTHREGGKARIAFFNAPLRSFPYLVVEHNEDYLLYNNQYTFDRLEVETRIASFDTPSEQWRQALIIIDDKMGDEIYAAGLSFIIEIIETEPAYIGQVGMQLRMSSELPKAMWPELSYDDPKHGTFSLSLLGLRIDRVTGDADMELDWPLNRGIERFTCEISDDLESDLTEMIRDSFSGIIAERKRITKSGTKNRL